MLINISCVGQEPGGIWLAATSGPGPRFAGAFVSEIPIAREH